MNWKNLPALLAVFVVSSLSLGSTVCGGDPSPGYESRWYRGHAQRTIHWTAEYSRIVFSHLGRIYTVDADGESIRSLSDSTDPVHLYTDTTEVDFSPFPSPDGSQVDYTTLRYAEGDLWNHTWEIVSQPVDGSKRRRLTNNDWDDISPAWSPDGFRIAFVSKRGDDYGIFTMSPDGSNQLSITPSVGVLPNAPVWAPDSSRLAFVAVEGEREVVYTVRAEGSELTRIPWPNAAHDNLLISESIHGWQEQASLGALRWSPDSERIAILAGLSGWRKGMIFAAAVDGSEAREVLILSDVPNADEYDWIRNIAWSLDGSEIGFEVVSGLDVTGYLIEWDGANLRQAAEPGDTEAFLAWSKGLYDVGRGVLQVQEVSAQSSQDSGVSPRHNWKLSLYGWGNSPRAPNETILARSVDDQWVAARPPQSAASEEGGGCSRLRVGGNPFTSGGLVRDCRTLLSIRDTLAGDEVLYWNADTSIREWPGITVEGRPPRVTEIHSVPTVRLSGTIPPEISRLDALRVLNLADNALTGSMPAEIGQMQSLEVLDLGDRAGDRNELTGSIPPELSNLTGLKTLDLSGNSFTGVIPAELGDLANLEELSLSDNPLEGAVPSELGKLSSLRVLYLGGHRNQLTGTIPPELGNLTNLEELTINWTNLAGPIPPELGKLSRLRELHLRGSAFSSAGDGQLSGPVPPELGNLKHLQYLNLEQNQLSGAIPLALGDLIPDEGGYYLTYVNLSGNRFTGCAPAKLKQVWHNFIDVPFCE